MSGEIPQLETPGRRPYADHPDDLEERVLDLRQSRGAGAVVIAHVLRVRDGLSIANNRVHEILQEHDHVTENPTKQGRKRPWVRFEREYSGVSVHIDWYHNDRGQWCVAVEDDASRHVFGMIETDANSASHAVELLESVDEEFDSPVPILVVITDHGSKFVNSRQEDRPDRDHEFERYLYENGIEHALCKVERPHPIWMIGDSAYDTLDWHDLLLAAGVVPIAPYNPRNTDDPLDIEYRVEDRIENHGEDVQLKRSVLDETYNRRTQVERTNDAVKSCGLGHVRARGRVHARTQVFLALCLRLVVAITNDERGNNPGRELLTA